MSSGRYCLFTVPQQLVPYVLPRPLWKLWRGWLGGDRWRLRQLKGSVVQLQWRAKIEARRLWWLYLYDSVPIGEISCGVYIATGIHIDGCSAFPVQYLL